jgi:hypothetical protein
MLIKIKHQLKSRHLFKIVITLKKTIKNKSCTLFPNQSNTEGKTKIKKHIRLVSKVIKPANLVTRASTTNL